MRYILQWYPKGYHTRCVEWRHARITVPWGPPVASTLVKYRILIQTYC
jgi:hypothetical protein